MNSVLEIGENIIYLKNGKKEWEGDKNSIVTSDNQALLDFVFSSKIFKMAREAMLYHLKNKK